MMQEVRSHDGSPGASVAVKQRPVVQHQVFSPVLRRENIKQTDKIGRVFLFIHHLCTNHCSFALGAALLPQRGCRVIQVVLSLRSCMTRSTESSATMAGNHWCSSGSFQTVFSESAPPPSAVYLHQHYITQFVTHYIIGVRAAVPQTAPELQDISLVCERTNAPKPHLSPLDVYRHFWRANDVFDQHVSVAMKASPRTR